MKKKVLNNKLREKATRSNSSSFSKYFYPGLILILLLLFPIKVLKARDFRTDEYLKAWTIKNKDNFSVNYTHSVQLTEVKELYQVEGSKIILRETYFKSYGAGLPATTSYDFEITEEGFRIYNINEIITNLIYRTGAERADHRMLIHGREIRFLDFSKPRTGVKLDIGRMPFISYIVREGFR